MNAVRAIVLVLLLATTLSSCESLRLKLKGGSESGVDWGVGVVF